MFHITYSKICNVTSTKFYPNREKNVENRAKFLFKSFPQIQLLMNLFLCSSQLLYCIT